MQIQVLPQIDATVCKPAKRPDFQSGHRKMCAGSNPVRSTNGNDVTQVVTLVCKTRAFGRCEFESRHSHNKGERQRWRVGLVCKISVLRLSGFDSHLSHKYGPVVYWLGHRTFTAKKTDRNRSGLPYKSR